MTSLAPILELHSWLLPPGHMTKTWCWALTLVSCTSRPWALLHFLGPPGFCVCPQPRRSVHSVSSRQYMTQPFSFASGEMVIFLQPLMVHLGVLHALGQQHGLLSLH